MEEKYKEKLKYLENYNISEKRKIDFIKKLYKLANISFDMFMEENKKIK